MKLITISKSKFLIGLKCPKHLWCLFNAPDLIPEIDESTQALFDQGHEVGNLAKKLYPKGIEVDWNKGFQNTLTETKELLKQQKPLFEASFKFNNAYCRSDIIVPTGKDWDIFEVKSSTEVKDEHLWDVAFQKYCLENSGLHIRKCHVIVINNEYTKKGKINPEKFFTTQDVTDKISELIQQIGDLIKKMLEIIQNPKIPTPELGIDCIDPSECPVCMNDLPENNVTELYRLGKKAYPLLNKKIIKITDLPKDFKLTEKQKIQYDSILLNKPHINVEEIKKFLKTLKYPLYFLDFETINPAIPLFEETRPYQHIPFQLSLHIVKKTNEKPEHVEFLADNPEDPRPGIINALKAIGKTGTVLAYNMTFEKNVIEALQEAFPKEKWLHEIIDKLNDLIIPFQNFWYYDPKQHGSCSIKAVLPALTYQSYEHLEVSKGDQAARKFLQMTYKEKKSDDKLRKALLEYCKQDTQGMIDILNVLEHVARQ